MENTVETNEAEEDLTLQWSAENKKKSLQPCKWFSEALLRLSDTISNMLTVYSHAHNDIATMLVLVGKMFAMFTKYS